ncbi:MAG: hypothetical protein M0C28_03190 [Candidatus Moduliflexus flocculans]|nr:hypothetical protein [Candidatus Moduliflexus flocculans]
MSDDGHALTIKTREVERRRRLRRRGRDPPLGHAPGQPPRPGPDPARPGPPATSSSTSPAWASSTASGWGRSWPATSRSRTWAASFKLCRISDKLLLIFKITMLDKVLDIHEDCEPGPGRASTSA